MCCSAAQLFITIWDNSSPEPSKRLMMVSMRIVQGVFTSVVVNPTTWRGNWAWGLPLIVLTVLIHVLGLGLMMQTAVRVSSRTIQRRHPTAVFVMVIGSATWLATFLHGIEAGIWAAAYRLLGALPDNKSAMLYSLNAITSYYYCVIRSLAGSRDTWGGSGPGGWRSGGAGWQSRMDYAVRSAPAAPRGV